MSVSSLLVALLGTTSGCSSGYYFQLLFWVLLPADLLVLLPVALPGTTSKLKGYSYACETSCLPRTVHCICIKVV